ncbi:hypothetical protein E9228_000507 [Curtobacterium flaccumfaciens]|uniref:Anti-sigma-K factor rskA n=1 Tax=Curtobacterium salicis TaxID=1779862 RepID=A0ABX0T325_9MICO|nr:anti-sigma factor [Curtobacterium sp. WW7]NII39888.1 hypothetical protein [Curtobacterium sp. WW7]
MNHIDEETLALLAIGDTLPTDATAGHLLDCARCRGELEDLRRVVTVARSSQSLDLVAPSARVWERIATDLGFDETQRPSPAAVPVVGPAVAPAATPSPTSGDDHVRRRRPGLRRRTVALLTAAGVVAGLVVGFGAAALVGTGAGGGSDAVVSQARLAALPGWSGAHGTAALERDTDGRLSLVVDVDPRTSDGTAPLREVWMMRSDLSGLVSVGFLDGDQGRFTVPSGVDPSRYPVVDVSAESADGDPAHSGDSVVRGTLRADG